MRRGGAATDENGMPAITAPSASTPPPAHFPSVLVRRHEDLADLQRRLEACLLIVRHVAPALTAAR